MRHRQERNPLNAKMALIGAIAVVVLALAAVILVAFGG